MKELKEFDFVKLTLWLALLFTAGLAALYFWEGYDTRRIREEIRLVEKICKDVGVIKRDIGSLRKEKKEDKTPDSTEVGINTYFFNQAREAGITANEDYSLAPREPARNEKQGYVDQSFNITFKKDRPKTREQITSFIFNVESQSRRIKLTKLKWSLLQDKASLDLWNAESLTFVRRDPIKALAAAPRD